MPDLLSKIASVFGKKKPASQAPEQAPREQALAAPEPATGPQPDAMSDAELAQWVAASSEKELFRHLHLLNDAEPQLRIVRAIKDEAVLKRIGRSQFDKKVRRQAEKQLRELAERARDTTPRDLDRLSLRIEEFLASPRWQEGDELLRESRRLEEAGASSAGAAAEYGRFLTLHKSLRAEMEAYQRTCLELEELCDQVEPSVPRSEAELRELKAHFAALEERYRYPEGFAPIARFRGNLEARVVNARHAEQEAKARAREAEKARQLEREKKAAEERRQRDEEKKARSRRMEKLLEELKELATQLDKPHAEARLRQLKEELQTLARFRSQLVPAYKEAEDLLKELKVKRGEVAQDARWSAWARTDRATRLEEELQALLGAIKAETDPDGATRLAEGLSQKLYDSSKEMRELGSLERDKDHKIWERYKALSDRGWALCDQMRQKTFELLLATVSAVLEKPLEPALPGLSDPRARLRLKPEALEAPFAAKVKELHGRFTSIGARRTDAGRELESRVARLFEVYFKEYNLHHSQLKRQELNAVQRKKDLLRELKARCEDASTALLERIRHAHRLEKRWTELPAPESAREELESELGQWRDRLSAEVLGELERQLGAVGAIRAKAADVLAQVEAKSGVKLPKALQSISGFETELSAIEKAYAELLSFLKTDNTPFLERLSPEVAQTRVRLKEARAAIEAEMSRRLGARAAVITESERLAISSDWETASARLEELKRDWKSCGAVGREDDPNWDIYFRHLCDFFASRQGAREKPRGATEAEAALKARRDLVCSLAALARFEKDAPSLELPFDPEEQARASGKILEMGMKYRQILALEPKNGMAKETRVIMEQWSRVSGPDEGLARYWDYYLARLRSLLQLR